MNNSSPPLTAVQIELSRQLASAASVGDTDEVRRLLSCNVSLVATGRRKFSPLHHAVYGRHYDTVELLLSAGADTEAKDRWGRNLLFTAAELGYPDMIERLLN